MSTPPRRPTRAALEAAQRRVSWTMEQRDPATSRARRRLVIAAALALFGAFFALRFVVHDPGALIANFYTLPIALLAAEFGLRAGLGAAAFAFALVAAWAAVKGVDLGVLGYASRGAAFVLVGTLVGHFAERLREDIAGRRRAQRELELYADELERANTELGHSVVRLQAFAQIARSVGGETDPERVLALILAQGREILSARELVACLPEDDELLVIAGGPGAPCRIPRAGSLPGEVLASGRARRAMRAEDGRLDELSADAHAVILVPLDFRGDTLGVLVGIDPLEHESFDDEDEQLMRSIAASAATALATARTVAADRLRLSIEAAEDARRRWARDLHDETLQGLGGVRMVLSSALAREDPAALREAVRTAQDHLVAQVGALRDLIAELRPAALDDLGLAPAIRTLADRQAAAGGFSVEVDVGMNGAGRLPHEVESTIYRLVQEATSNVVKHARAERVVVAVAQENGRVEVLVEDDGRGFDPAARTEGLGLIGMRERVGLAGGRVEVSSGPGGPTRVRAVVPVGGG